ncbi:MAG: hypothetical protein LBR17_01480 [Bacteroidales bacterium]|jgi:hypothetical protein|nr:hypothetical protein [Bacteroidales bacterium]
MKLKKTTLAALIFVIVLLGTSLLNVYIGNRKAMKDVEEYKKSGVPKYGKEYLKHMHYEIDEENITDTLSIDE